MYSVLKNSEFKSAALNIIAAQVLFLVIVLLFTWIGIYNIQKKVISNNEALLGKVLYTHPGYENEITGIITKSATRNEINTGRNILKKYGYGEESIGNLSEPLIAGVFKYYGKYEVLIAILYTAILVILIYFEYGKIYKKVRNICRASERVVEGNFRGILPENCEGEFGILGHSFNIMAERVEKSIYALKEDKIFLKNIISDISHQIKTPLSSLIAMNDLMVQKQDMKAEDRIDFLKRSANELQRMEWLILNMLKLARLEAGAITFKKEKTNIFNVVQNSVDSIKNIYEVKNQNVSISGDKSASFMGDDGWTQEAVTNIIKNSIEHTKTFGSIDINISSTPIFSKIVIVDNGEGIDVKDLPHIFERFYRGSSSVNPQSIGIGLSLSKIIVENQNGMIMVESKKGAGSSFIITFLNGVI